MPKALLLDTSLHIRSKGLVIQCPFDRTPVDLGELWVLPKTFGNNGLYECTKRHVRGQRESFWRTKPTVKIPIDVHQNRATEICTRISMFSVIIRTDGFYRQVNSPYLELLVRGALPPQEKGCQATPFHFFQRFSSGDPL